MSAFIWKKIGILGGMGPEATAEFYRRLIGIFQRDYGAKKDSDFPQIYIYSMPLPDILNGSLDESLVVDFIENGIKSLESLGCDFISVPCNTVFYFMDRVRKNKPVLDLIEQTYVEAKKRKLRKVGLLSSRKTATNRLYEKRFRGIDIIQPDEMEKEVIDAIIWRILSGTKDADDRNFLKETAGRLKDSGAEAVILGCTDLPLIVSDGDFDVEILDTLGILAEKTAEFARID